MKFRLRPLIALLLLLVAAGGAGCGDNDPDADYVGTWTGPTSRGGTIEFTVGAGAVTSLRITDSQARAWMVQPVEIEGSGFTVSNSAGIVTPDSPAVSVECTFDSADQCSGSYAIATWTGTFTATKQ